MKSEEALQHLLVMSMEAPYPKKTHLVAEQAANQLQGVLIHLEQMEKQIEDKDKQIELLKAQISVLEDKLKVFPEPVDVDTP